MCCLVELEGLLLHVLCGGSRIRMVDLLHILCGGLGRRGGLSLHLECGGKKEKIPSLCQIDSEHA